MFSKDFLIAPCWVANNFLLRGQRENIKITPLKLQRLIYFLYASYLSVCNEKLFTERFETWKKGPALPSIYIKFGCYGKNSIKTYAKDSTDKVVIVSESDTFKTCIDIVWAMFKDLQDDEFYAFFCQETSAWKKAEKNNHSYLDDQDIIYDGNQIIPNYVKKKK